MGVTVLPHRHMLMVSCLTLVIGADNFTTIMQDLRNDLFVKQNYSPIIRPVYDEYQATNVFLSLHLKSINSFDEVAGILSISAYMFISWYDEFLTWNSSDYYDLPIARWPQDAVWKPDVTFYNTADKYQALGHSSMLVENRAGGVIDWSPMEVFHSSCSVDMTYFPYDIQTCELQFMSWSYTNDSVKLYTAIDYIDQTDFTPNPQWEIISTNIYIVGDPPGNNVDMLSFNIEMRRKPRYHITSMLLPIVLLAVLDIFVFTLPSDGGEKSGYAVTVFLAFAVFLTIVNSNMPENSEKLSIFSVYIIIQTMQSTLITILSLILIRLASFDETKKIPSVFTVMTRLVNCKNTCGKKCTKKVNTIENKEKDPDDTIDSINSFENESYTWKQVVNAADTVCFILFSAVLTISTAVCFCIIVRGP